MNFGSSRNRIPSLVTIITISILAFLVPVSPVSAIEDMSTYEVDYLIGNLSPERYTEYIGGFVSYVSREGRDDKVDTAKRILVSDPDQDQTHGDVGTEGSVDDIDESGEE